MSGEAEATETYRRREYAVPCWIDSCTHGRPRALACASCRLCGAGCSRQEAGVWTRLGLRAPSCVVRVWVCAESETVQPCVLGKISKSKTKRLLCEASEPATWRLPAPRLRLLDRCLERALQVDVCPSLPRPLCLRTATAEAHAS